MWTALTVPGEPLGELWIGDLGSIRSISSCPRLGDSPPYRSPPITEAGKGFSSFASPSLLGLGVGLRPHRLGGSQGSEWQAGTAQSPWVVGGECGAVDGVGEASPGLQ